MWYLVKACEPQVAHSWFSAHSLPDRGVTDLMPTRSSFSVTNRYAQSRYSSVGIALGYGLDDRGSRVWFPAGTANFSLHHRVQNGSGAHPASYQMSTRGSFPGGKAAGSWNWPLTSI
jgi:hypothetical protein